MKRNELSLHRKEQMAASLKKLMTRKNLGRITIQELADDCGINRYTFYYHFQDIYDLLSWTFRQDFEKLFADRSRCPTLEAWIQNLIRYLKENAAVCKSALSSMGGDSFRRICVEDISGMMHDRLRELCRGRAVPD
ncbi:MAG: TetR family transcriptional regulator, partial [Enterocloster sp.]